MFVFNSSGLLVPDSLIKATFQDLKETFVDNTSSLKRIEIFKDYVKYNEDLKKACNLDELRQWINGSFVTKKENPGDIDLVTFLDHELIVSLGDKLENFKFPNSEKIYGVDGYIVQTYSENHRNAFLSISDTAYWYNRFTKTRRVRGNKLSKGFLEIIFK